MTAKSPAQDGQDSSSGYLSGVVTGYACCKHEVSYHTILTNNNTESQVVSKRTRNLQ